MPEEYRQTLEAKNDSLIISERGNGYEIKELKKLLESANNSYLHVFVGDHKSEDIIERERNKNVRFVNVKTSDLQMTKNQGKFKEVLL